MNKQSPCCTSKPQLSGAGITGLSSVRCHRSSGTKSLSSSHCQRASSASGSVREAAVTAQGENATGDLICTYQNKEEMSPGRWFKQTWFSAERVPPGSRGCFKETDAGTCRMQSTSHL